VPRLDALEERCVPTLTGTDGGMTVYSSVTRTHWLADANLAANETWRDAFGLQDIDADGSMTFSQAQKWVFEMNSYDGGKGYLGHNNWTLPVHFAGAGFNQTTSDMGKLFYLEFGGHAGESITEIDPPSFQNFQPYFYWDGQVKSPGGAQFSFGNGFQGTSKDSDVMYVIPEYSDHQSQGTADPGTPDGIPPPPKHFPPVSNSLVASTDGKIIYDQALDMYWLADANLAATNTFGIRQGINPHPKDGVYININPDGSMNYATAVAWIDAMNAQDYLGHNNWRLPMATDASAAYYITGSGIGDTFQGSEMGELYYTELGATAGSTILLPTSAAEAPFSNFQPYLYWAGSQTAASNANGNGHSTFSFGSGFQGANIDSNQMYVIPVFDAPRKVTSTSDSGFGSLRWVIAAAHAGDTIDLSGLAGQTITLQSPININRDNEGQYEALDMEGPGAANLAISGNNVTGIFDLGPAPTETATTTIAGLTLENAQAQEGGAILDNGAALSLRADTFDHDQAETNGFQRAPALGGALAVLGNASNSMQVAVTDCQFTNDAVVGLVTIDGTGIAEGGAIYVDAGTSTDFTLSVSGTTFGSDFARGGAGWDGVVLSAFNATLPKDGGPGDGGAVYLAADQAHSPSFTFASDTFSDCTAAGGPGGNGAAANSGQRGGQGGRGSGGALSYAGGRAVVPNLSIVSSTFMSNSAIAGDGGAGGGASTPTGNGNAGGSGGESLGGAVSANLSSAIGGIAVLQGDTFTANISQGGNGGAGGSGGSAATGGAGGAGGSAGGGAIAGTVNGPAVAAALNIIMQSHVTANTAQGGNGGAGGTGRVGGRGGLGAGIWGAGLYLNGTGGAGAGTWTLYADTVESNKGQSGKGGQGGDGSKVGGNGGDGNNALGGGIFDAFTGALDFIQCFIESSDLIDAVGGSGGHGSVTGSNGLTSVSRGGGLYVASRAKARATADTTISGNGADMRPNVFGILGTL
jgi:hypothetical protein